MHIPAIFPMLCAIAAFVLSMLCLFAGSKPGFMEEYSILTLNTSMVGQNLLSTSSSSTSSSASAAASSSLASILGREAPSEKGIGSDINGAIGDEAGKLASELGIKQWYSMHMMDMCEGTYTPNATLTSAKLNVTSCTNVTAMYHFNISEQISNELEAGGHHLDLSDIDWPSDIQSGLNALNISLDALFVLYAMGTAAAGVSIFTSLVSVFLHGSHFVLFTNWGLASLSSFALLIASLIITIVQIKAVDLINKDGNKIGVYAYKGNKFLILTWVAVGLMLCAVAAWSVNFCIARRAKNREYTEKVGSGSWWQRGKNTDAASVKSYV